MKVVAFFLCIILMASCKNEKPSNPLVGTATKELSNDSSDQLYAQIGFEDRRIDLGKIVSFDNNQVIHFTNEGDTTLVINDVYSSSDRIEVFAFTYEIAPGGQGKIRFKIDQHLAHQAFSDYIFVKTNNNNVQSLARLELKYELSDDLIVGGIFVENGDRINVRMFPALDATVLFGLEKDDRIKCIGAMNKDYVEDFDTDLWYYVNYNGRKGWILSALTDFEQAEVVAMQ